MSRVKMTDAEVQNIRRARKLAASDASAIYATAANLTAETAAREAADAAISATIPGFTSTAADPTVDADTLHGYITGWKWYNTSSHALFTCVDATNGAAVWL